MVCFNPLDPNARGYRNEANFIAMIYLIGSPVGHLLDRLNPHEVAKCRKKERPFKWCFRIPAMLSLLLISNLSVGGVLYENPIGSRFAEEYSRASFEELVSTAEREPVTLEVVKAQFMLGLAFLTGERRWDVEKNIDRGREYLQESWANGAADAGYTLAQIYQNGIGVDRDPGKALVYLTESAELGLLVSQRALGEAYLDEVSSDWRGVADLDVQLAVNWLEKAANAGDLESANILADVYYTGRLVEKEDELAFFWLLKSSESELGYNLSTFLTVAELYEKGVGTDVDLVEAYRYYDIASPAGDDDKARLAEEMTDEQIAEAIRQSRAWQEEHNTFSPSYYDLEYQDDGGFR